jgi:hypothetical protein
MKTPRMARTDDDLIAMRRDNITVGDHWMLMQETEHGIEFVIANQKLGEAPTGKVYLPTAVFAAMVDWFNVGKVPRWPTRKPRILGDLYT